ncbi:hypothetical protein PIB30_013158 [Stylosanthes scabra]|uniref:ATP-dependent DNA ligase family profile domain-containing protein n=1 Tax=Stylosanthes scabra TaxID=79078 RepID=A0ABU6Y6M5_9FABA|nr:hypothetical protein [Stylosanthes scabra]
MNRVKKSTVSTFVLDCEIVGYDREKKTIRSFQELSGRLHKNVSMDNIKVDVCIFAFDILYLNGQSLLQDNLKIRREHLYASFEEETGVFEYATAITTNDIEEMQEFLDQAVASSCDSCEGLIIKTLVEDSTYEPSNRSNNWLKLKKDYLKNIGDSLDLVPIAAFHGRGKRFPRPGDHKECMVLFFLLAMTAIMKNFKVFVGLGISLRFPRFVRLRPDKEPEEATSSEQVKYNLHKFLHKLVAAKLGALVQ